MAFSKAFLKKALREAMGGDAPAMLGSGRSKSVFEDLSDPSKVSVRMQRNAATEEFLNFARRSRADNLPYAEHLPNVSDLRADGDAFTYRADRLLPNNSRVRIGRDNGDFFLTGLPDDDPQRASLLEAARAMKAHLDTALPGSSHYYDLHPDNLMRTKDGRLIINDPTEGGDALRAPLDMSTQARMARAREQGFDVDAYHATTRDFDAFRNDAPINGATEDARGAMFFAKRPGTTDPYSKTSGLDRFSSADEFRRIAETVRPEQQRDLRALADKVSAHEELVAGARAKISAIDAKYGHNGPITPERKEAVAALGRLLDNPPIERTDIRAALTPATLPVKLRMQNPYTQDMRGEDWSEGAYTLGLDAAKRGGHDGVVFKNVREMGAPADDVYAVFDPKNIRSRFAAFAPAKRDSSDLLASLIPALGVGGIEALRRALAAQQAEGGA